MRFQMIFEGVDRASKVMDKLMAAEKKTAKAMSAGAKASAGASAGTSKATERLSSALSKVGNVARAAYSGVVAGANAAARATKALHDKSVNLAKHGFGQIGAGAGKAFRGVALAAGVATVGIGGVTLAAGQLVGTASQFEKFQTILETTEGSSAKAKAAMAWVTNFAAKTPYELDGVMEAFVQLRSSGLDPTKGLLLSLGNTSAAMGKPLMQAVEAMADAVTGENERLKEFGITAEKTGNKITYTYTNAAGKQMQASVKANNRMAIQQKLMAIFSEKYGGAMEKLSATWDGMVSNLADIWSQFMLAIMSAGLFDWMKEKLKLVLDTVNQMAADGTLKQWATEIGERIKFVLSSAWEFGKGVYLTLKTLGTYLSVAAEYVGGWENLAIVLGSLAIAPVLISTAAGIVQIVTGLAMLGTALAGLSITAPLLAIGAGIGKLAIALKAMGVALMANPIVLIVAAIAAAAVAIYVYWEPIKAFFLNLWNGIAKGAMELYNRFVQVTGFDPLGAIMRMWGGVSSAISSALADVGPVVSGIWDTVKAVLAWHPAVIIYENWGQIRTKAVELLEAAFGAVSGVWDRVKALFNWSPVETIMAAWAGVADAVGGFIDDAANRAGAAWSRVKSIFSFGESSANVTVTDPTTVLAAAAATEKLAADMQAVSAIDTGPAMDKLSALDASAKKIAPVVIGAVRQAQSFLGGISFYDQGAALMDTMAAGMRARASVVIGEIQRMTQTLRDHLPSSPAKVGPLSDIHRLKFGETIAGSIRAEPMVKAMRAAALATMGAASINAPSMAAPSVAVAGADAARAEVARVSASSTNSNSKSNADGTAGGIVLHFSPTIPITASGNVASIRDELKRQLPSLGRELAAVLDEELRRRGRTTV